MTGWKSAERSRCLSMSCSVFIVNTLMSSRSSRINSECFSWVKAMLQAGCKLPSAQRNRNKRMPCSLPRLFPWQGGYAGLSGMGLIAPEFPGPGGGC